MCVVDVCLLAKADNSGRDSEMRSGPKDIYNDALLPPLLFLSQAPTSSNIEMHQEILPLEQGFPNVIVSENTCKDIPRKVR